MKYWNRSIYIQVRSGETLTTLKDLRMLFSVEKTKYEPKDSGQVVIYNLSENTKSLIEQSDYLSIFAGYEGIGIASLIQGRVEEIVTERVGGDFATSINLFDGIPSKVQNALVSDSWSSGVSVLGIIRVLTNSRGVKLFIDPRIKDKTLKSGYVSYGLFLQEIRTLAKKVGAMYMVDDGILQIWKKESFIENYLVLSPESGLIGTPQKIFENGRDVGLRITSLLNPGLKPRGTIMVKSKEHNGSLGINTVSHSGDTHGTEWYTIIEGVMNA